MEANGDEGGAVGVGVYQKSQTPFLSTSLRSGAFLGRACLFVHCTSGPFGYSVAKEKFIMLSQHTYNITVCS